MEYKPVVTAFLQAEDRILLLKRSGKVGTYKGRWAGVSGYLEADEEPLRRALTELKEEVGLGESEVRLVRGGQILRAYDEAADTVWVIHPFLFNIQNRDLRLDWEHTEQRWMEPGEFDDLETVPNLKQAFERVRWDLNQAEAGLPESMRQVVSVAQDRAHGAGEITLRALEALDHAAKESSASTLDELFRDLLAVTLRLRSAQPAMASVRNSLGTVLYEVDSHRRDAKSADDLKAIVASTVKETVDRTAAASEDAARNMAAMVADDSRILTHSYSKSAKRAIELAFKSHRRVEVCATESSPGMEGRELAKDLVADDVEVKLVADTAVEKLIPETDLVIVGADSILKEGGIVNKLGTHHIAALAQKRAVDVFAVAETMKFNIADFLGDPLNPGELFDVTPPYLLTKIVTEAGALPPAAVETRLKAMVRATYP